MSQKKNVQEQISCLWKLDIVNHYMKKHLGPTFATNNTAVDIPHPKPFEHDAVHPLIPWNLNDVEAETNSPWWQIYNFHIWSEWGAFSYTKHYLFNSSNVELSSSVPFNSSSSCFVSKMYIADRQTMQGMYFKWLHSTRVDLFFSVQSCISNWFL